MEPTRVTIALVSLLSIGGLVRACSSAGRVAARAGSSFSRAGGASRALRAVPRGAPRVLPRGTRPLGAAAAGATADDLARVAGRSGVAGRRGAVGELAPAAGTTDDLARAPVVTDELAPAGARRPAAARASEGSDLTGHVVDGVDLASDLSEDD